jgi:large subunit ribosomal protein L32
MAVPKKKMSRSRRDRRRAHEALGKMNLVPCPTCRALMRPHAICPTCGNYRGVKYLQVEDTNAKK